MGHPQVHMDQWSFFSHSATWTVSESQELSSNTRVPMNGKKHEHVFFSHLEAIDEQQLF